MLKPDNLSETSFQLKPYIFKTAGVVTETNVTKGYNKHVYSRSGFKFSPKSSGRSLETGLFSCLPVSDSHATIWPLRGSGAQTWKYPYQNFYYSVDDFLAYAFKDDWASVNSAVIPRPSLISTAEMGAMTDELLIDACGRMPPVSSLLVDLAEIGQTIAMVTSARGLIKELPRRLRKRLVSPTHGKGMKSVIRDLAGVDLAYKFGIKPLIGTLDSLYNWESAVQSRLNQLALRNADQRPFRLSRRIARQYVSPSYGPFVSPQWGISAGTESYTISDIAACSCWVKAQYNMNARTAWKLTQDYLALNSFANAAWNLIPFSFVVDWVVNIGDLAKRIEDRIGLMSASDNIGRAEILNPCYSLKRDCFLTMAGQTAAVSDGSYPADIKYAWQKRIRNYTRTPGLVRDLPLSLATSGWNSWRTGTGAELVIQLAGHR